MEAWKLRRLGSRYGYPYKGLLTSSGSRGVVVLGSGERMKEVSRLIGDTHTRGFSGLLKELAALDQGVGFQGLDGDTETWTICY